MSKKIKVSKIEIETDSNKKVSLSLDEAKELYDQLNELFGNKYINTAPVIIDRYTRPYWDRYWYSNTNDLIGQFTCNSTDNSLSVTYSGSSVD